MVDIFPEPKAVTGNLKDQWGVRPSKVDYSSGCNSCSGKNCSSTDSQYFKLADPLIPWFASINVVMKLTDSTAYTFELLSIDGQKY